MRTMFEALKFFHRTKIPLALKVSTRIECPCCGSKIDVYGDLKGAVPYGNMTYAEGMMDDLETGFAELRAKGEKLDEVEE